MFSQTVWLCTMATLCFPITHKLKAYHCHGTQSYNLWKHFACTAVLSTMYLDYFQRIWDGHDLTGQALCKPCPGLCALWIYRPHWHSHCTAMIQSTSVSEATIVFTRDWGRLARMFQAQGEWSNWNDRFKRWSPLHQQWLTCVYKFTYTRLIIRGPLSLSSTCIYRRRNGGAEGAVAPQYTMRTSRVR